MKTIYKIGRDKTNEFIIRNSNYKNTIANIKYVNGHWILKKHPLSIPIFINKNEVQDSIKLSKYDIIRIENQNIHWCNYLYEGENQELQMKDFLSYNGRINLSNFKALNILILGLLIVVFFLPGLLQLGRRYRGTVLQGINEIQGIAPIIHTTGYAFLGILMLLIAIKRIRDTGNPIWKILVPFYNLKLLYFEPSNRE